MNLDRAFECAMELDVALESDGCRGLRPSKTVPAARSAMWRVKCCFARAGSSRLRVLRVRVASAPPALLYFVVAFEKIQAEQDAPDSPREVADSAYQDHRVRLFRDDGCGDEADNGDD